MNSAETKILLCNLLLQAKLAKSVEDMVIVLENMCEKEWIAAVNDNAKKIKERNGED